MTDSQRDSWSISVVRSGGFAGLKREWRVNSADAPEVDWAKLIAACPWNTAVKSADGRSRDRFAWRIETTGPRRCVATLNDGQITGAWKALVDEVRRKPGS